jgi:hypothetical protein
MDVVPVSELLDNREDMLVPLFIDCLLNVSFDVATVEITAIWRDVDIRVVNSQHTLGFRRHLVF